MREPAVAQICTAFGLFIVGGIFGFFDWLFGPTALADFVRDLIVAFAAVPLAIAAGLEINRRWQRSQERDRRQMLLRTVKSSLQSNVMLLRRASEILVRGACNVPTYRLDLVVLDATASQCHELLSDEQLLTAIDTAHYMLQHVDRRLDFLQGRTPLTLTFPFPPMNQQVVQDLYNRAAKFHETSPLAAKISETFHQAGQWVVSPEWSVCLEAKFGTVELIAGLTSIGEPTPTKPSGGAVGRCEKAIEAIDRALESDNQ